MRHTCGGCDKTWAGLSYAHCSHCHETFAGTTLFDEHQLESRRGRLVCESPRAMKLNDIGGGVFGRGNPTVPPPRKKSPEKNSEAGSE